MIVRIGIGNGNGRYVICGSSHLRSASGVPVLYIKVYVYVGGVCGCGCGFTLRHLSTHPSRRFIYHTVVGIHQMGWMVGEQVK